MGEQLADRIRNIVGEGAEIAEVKMFGGLCFMLNGNMLVCAMRDGALLARVGASAMDGALNRPGASRMDMGGRPMKDYVVVGAAHLGDPALREWIADARGFVGGLPPKVKTAKRQT